MLSQFKVHIMSDNQRKLVAAVIGDKVEYKQDENLLGEVVDINSTLIVIKWPKPIGQICVARKNIHSICDNLTYCWENGAAVAKRNNERKGEMSAFATRIHERAKMVNAEMLANRCY
jgi:hypothetical protein